MAAIAVLAGLLPTACGGGGTSSAVAPAKAGAGKQSRLGQARFQALDAVYVAALPGDKLRGRTNVTGAELKAAERPVVGACKVLDRNDALLRPLRRSCPLAATFINRIAAIGPACQDPTSCVTAIGGVRRALSRLLVSERSSDRAVDVANITAACKGALRSSPAAHTAYRAFGSALALLQRGLATQSQTDIVEAQRRLRAAQQLGDALPSGKQELEKFRKACA